MYNDSLLQLIETFTPNEKNNFKRYIAFTGGGRSLKYEELYNIYNRHLGKGYDKATFDKKVKAAFIKKPQLRKDLNNIRKRLKDKLLESLIIQNSSNSREAELSQGINEIRILIERKMLNAAFQKIKQLKDKTQPLNQNKYLIELIEMEILIIERSSGKDDEMKLKNLIDAQQNHLHEYSIELQLKNVFKRMNMIVEKDMKLSKKKHLTQLNQLLNEIDDIPIFEYHGNKHVYIVLWYYKIKSLYHRFVGEIDLAYNYGKLLIDFFESDETILKNFQKEYVKAICSYSRTCFYLNKDDELNQILTKTQNIYQNQKNYNALEASCEMGVLHYLNTFQYKKADKIATLLDENWQYFERKTMDGKLLWHTHTNSILYWILDDREKLNLWANRGLNIQRPNKGKFYFFGIRMLMLIYDYDINELFYFNEKVQALQKTMSNNDDLKSFEKIVLKYLKKIASVEISRHTKREKATLTQTLFEEFKSLLLGLQAGKTNFVQPINYEEILIWCDSHLQNKSIKAVFEARSK